MFEPIPPSNLLKIYKGCSHCRVQKIKCNGQEPCLRCKAFGLQCQYIVLPNQAALKGLASSSATSSSTSPSSPVAPLTSLAPSPSSSSSLSPSSVAPASGAAAAAISKPRSTKKKGSTASTSSSQRRTGSSSIASSTAPSSKRRKEASSNESSSPILPSPNHEGASDVPESPLPNVLMEAILQAVDPTMYAYREPPADHEPCPGPETMRHLISLYLQYLHPVQRLVNEDHPEFWNRLYHPMDSSTAVVVYAMCAAGALFTDNASRPSGHLERSAFEFYRRARAILDTLAPSAASIQAYLMMQPYLTATHQGDEHRRVLELMLETASEINLAETARQIAEQDKVSPADIIMRNTWRGVVWAEILHHLHTREGSLTIVPFKNLSGPALDTRPKDFPGTQGSPILDIVYYHLCSYFKILQSIAALKTPIAPRDVHHVTSLLDNIATWHSSLPRNLRHSSSSRTSSSASGSSSSSSNRSTHASSYAVTMALGFRLANIYVINTLPSYLRYSTTGLGPRRESPLRILATSANGITALMEEVVKEPTMKHCCTFVAMRCLTEAASIQLSNSKEADPSISTPAKINIMKTLWCVRQANLSVPPEILNPLLEHFNPPPPGQQMKASDGASAQTVRPAIESSKDSHIRTFNTGSEQPVSAPHQSMAFKTMRPPALVPESVVSDSSSTGGGQEQSPLSTPSMSPFQDADQRRRSFQYHHPSMAPEGNMMHPLSSPLHDGAASSLLALSLQSVTSVHSAAFEGSTAASRRQSFDPIVVETYPSALIKDAQTSSSTMTVGTDLARRISQPLSSREPLPLLSTAQLPIVGHMQGRGDLHRYPMSTSGVSPLTSPDTSLSYSEEGSILPSAFHSYAPPASVASEPRVTSPTVVQSPPLSSHYHAFHTTPTVAAGQRRASVLSLLDRDRPGWNPLSQTQHQPHQHPYNNGVGRRSSVSSSGRGGTLSPSPPSTRKPLSLNLTLHAPPSSLTSIPSEPAGFHSAPSLTPDHPQSRRSDEDLTRSSTTTYSTMSISNPTTPSAATSTFSFRHEFPPPLSPLSSSSSTVTDRQCYFQSHHGSNLDQVLHQHQPGTRRTSEYGWAYARPTSRAASPNSTRSPHALSASGGSLTIWHSSETALLCRDDSRLAYGSSSAPYSHVPSPQSSEDVVRVRSASVTAFSAGTHPPPPSNTHSLPRQHPLWHPQGYSSGSVRGQEITGGLNRHGASAPYLEDIQEHHSNPPESMLPHTSGRRPEHHHSQHQDQPPPSSMAIHHYQSGEQRPSGEDYHHHVDSAHLGHQYPVNNNVGPVFSHGPVAALATSSSPPGVATATTTTSGQMAGRKRSSVSLYDTVEHEQQSSGQTGGNALFSSSARNGGHVNSGIGSNNNSNSYTISTSNNTSSAALYFGGSDPLYSDPPRPTSADHHNVSTKSSDSPQTLLPLPSQHHQRQLHPTLRFQHTARHSQEPPTC